MKKNKLNIALIGMGYWGKNIARNLYEMGILKVIFDENLKVLNTYKKHYPEVIFVNNLNKFLEISIDAVFIATPAETHGKLVKIFLENNKHVFVEKPLCLDVEEGKKLIKLAKEKKLKLMVGHLLLYHSAFLALKTLVSKGGIGKIRYIYSHRLSLGKLRKEENALWSFAPHDISMILSLIGAEPKSVEAFGGYYLSKDIADTTITFMNFENGIKAHIFVSWLHPYKDQRLIIVGDKGMASFVDVEKKERKLLIYDHDIAWNGNIPLIEKAEGKPIKYDMSKEPLKEECQSFIEWILKNKKPPSDGEEGLKVLKVLNDADKDLKRKKNI